MGRAGHFVRPYVRLSAMLSPPKSLDRVQPNLLSELLTLVGRSLAHLFLYPPTGALEKGQNLSKAWGFAMACHVKHAL